MLLLGLSFLVVPLLAQTDLDKKLPVIGCKEW